MRYVVHGVDNEDVGEALQELAERHWAYMDGHADRLVARGPTLSADGTSHTGSVHVVEADSIDDAQRFAFDEPYWLAGVYASVTVTRVHSARSGTMWDRPPPDGSGASSLVLVSWPRQRRTDGDDGQLLERLDSTDPVIFGGVLASDDGTDSVGLVAAVDADIGPAAALIAGLGLPRVDDLGDEPAVATRGPSRDVTRSSRTAITRARAGATGRYGSLTAPVG